jgi:hypothetical protein
MSRYTDIKAELDTDTLVRGYAGMTDEEVVTDINTVYRTRVKSSVSGADAFQVTDATEFDTLTDAERSEWLSLCAIDTVDPANGTPAAAMATRIFGGGSTTLANLVAFRTENISRAVELGFGTIVIGDIQNARAL